MGLFPRIQPGSLKCRTWSVASRQTSVRCPRARRGRPLSSGSCTMRARRMDSARWERVQTLFHDAVDLPPVERLAFLRAACGADESLMSEVLAAIEEDERGSSLLDQGLAPTADRILGNDAAALRDIGPYRILRVVGEGGMGVVFLAEHRPRQPGGDQDSA